MQDSYIWFTGVYVQTKVRKQWTIAFRVLRSLVFSLYMISWVMPKLVVWSIACWRGYFKRHQYCIV